jgi:hypothetical protein
MYTPYLGFESGAHGKIKIVRTMEIKLPRISHIPL